MASPLQIARDAWLSWNPTGDFTALVAGYLTKGFVYSGDDAFVLAMPQGDTWYVHLAAGRVGRFQELAPYPLPFIAWERKCQGVRKVWSWARYQRLTKGKR